jgi:hypothetical protein
MGEGFIILADIKKVMMNYPHHLSAARRFAIMGETDFNAHLFVAKVMTL